jgi:hypothetical protein
MDDDDGKGGGGETTARRRVLTVRIPIEHHEEAKNTYSKRKRGRKNPLRNDG